MTCFSGGATQHRLYRQLWRTLALGGEGRYADAPDAPGNLLEEENSGGLIAHRYDALGRRINKVLYRHGKETEVISFLWSGLRMVGESSSLQPARNTQYLYSEGSWEPVARVDSIGGQSETFWYHTELNGLPERMTDERGEVVWRGRFSTWGETERENSTGFQAVQQNLRFQGQYLDRETGLHYNLFRYYDPVAGRFTQVDPIGLQGGLNLYAYAPNPLNWIDPLGLQKCMGVGESGHHVPSVRKSKGRPFAVSRSDKTRPTLFPRGTQPEHDHWRMHDAERAYVGPRQGDFLGSDKELFDAYRSAYSKLDDIKVDVLSPNGTYLLGENITPVKAIDLVERWLFEQGLI